MERQYLKEDVREAVAEIMADRTPVGVPHSSDEMRQIAGKVFDDRIPGHILRCPVGKDLKYVQTRLNYIIGALLLLGAMTSLGVWAIDRAATKQDEVQRAVHEVRIMVERQQKAELQAPTQSSGVAWEQ